MTHHATSSKSNPLWGGHFSEGPQEAFAAINPSVGFDHLLYAHDIAGSIAHCRMLAAQHILSVSEAGIIETGLTQILAEIDSGEFTFKTELEDVHMNIESRLKELVGDVAGKLHTARSRNDQVATDMRLYVRDALDDLSRWLGHLQDALLQQATRHTHTILPGYTHMQPAQPIVFGHHLMAYVEMFGRDQGRLRDARVRVNQCPLGSAALAGTPYPIDRHATAQALGFSAPMRNSLDGVSDRDFIAEPLAAFGLCAMHLSRLAEELVLWTSPAYGFVKLPEGFTSGSSIMPQKRNPDAAELIRGKSARIISAFSQIMLLMKALPLAYNKDTQEDKESFFDSYHQLRLCLQAMTGMIQEMKAQPDTMLAATQHGYLTATDAADWMVMQLGIPFREAHHLTGKLVRLAEESGCKLTALTEAQLQSVDARFGAALLAACDVQHSVASRKSFGGTAPECVAHAIAQVQKERS